jgi:hypothetical protein
MLNHTVYNEVLSCIDRAACAELSRAEVKRKVLFLISHIAERQGYNLPDWEQQILAKQLMYDTPNADRLLRE